MRLAECLAPYVASDLFDFVVLVVLPSVFLLGFSVMALLVFLTRVPTRPVVFQLLLAMLQTRTETAWTVNARPDIKVQ